MLQLEVQLPPEGAPLSGELAVLGEDPALGGGEASQAVRLFAVVSDEGASASLWRGEIPLPRAETEFKLISVQDGALASSEPLEVPRRFPSRVEDGVLLKMVWGQPRIGIEVSSELLERNAKMTRKMEDRVGSALQDNLDKKGGNAYYHAHNRHYEVPEHAKVISGPGLITGGAPVLLEAGAIATPPEDERTMWLKDYSWSDGTGKVKVYVPVPEGVLPATGAESVVEATYTSHQVDLVINTRPRRCLKIEKLNAEVDVDACTTRVEAKKNRIVLQLAKKRETTWYNLTKK